MRTTHRRARKRNFIANIRSCPGAEAVTIPGADHFFLLTHREETVAYLRRWLAVGP